MAIGSCYLQAPTWTHYYIVVARLRWLPYSIEPLCDVESCRSMITFGYLVASPPPYTRTPMLRSSPQKYLTPEVKIVEHFVINHHIASLTGFGVLGTEGLCGVDHVSQRSLGFWPLSGLEATIGIDPELFWAEVLQHLLDTIFDFLLTRNAR